MERTYRLEMQDKVYFAVRAHIRHLFTDYDAMLRGKGTNKWEAIKTIASQIAPIATSQGEPLKSIEYRDCISRHGTEVKYDDDEGDEYENEPSPPSSQDLDAPQPTRRFTRFITRKANKPTPTAVIDRKKFRTARNRAARRADGEQVASGR